MPGCNVYPDCDVWAAAHAQPVFNLLHDDPFKPPLSACVAQALLDQVVLSPTDREGSSHQVLSTKL